MASLVAPKWLKLWLKYRTDIVATNAMAEILTDILAAKAMAENVAEIWTDIVTANAKAVILTV